MPAGLKDVLRRSRAGHRSRRHDRLPLGRPRAAAPAERRRSARRAAHAGRCTVSRPANSTVGEAHTMRGTMMDFPLTLQHIFERGTRLFPDREIVTGRHSWCAPLHLSRFRSARPSSGQRAQGHGSASRRSGRPLSAGITTATSSCTSRCRCSGAVLHTLNIRLFHDQLTYIVNHAADRFIFVDRIAAAGRSASSNRPSRRSSGSSSSTMAATSTRATRSTTNTLLEQRRRALSTSRAWTKTTRR